MSLSPGVRLGPYEILALLGVGGMGEVWRAKDSRLGRNVAVKVLPEEFFEDEERRIRFEREARLLASLNHPGIAAIHSFEEIPGPSSSSAPGATRHLLVMELVEGDALSKRMKAGKIPMVEALSIGRDIAAALEAAHAKGIVHRDLKPGNVMMSSDGRVKLLDFGLAKAFEKEPASPDFSHSPTVTTAGTEAGVILGTAAYMSPEQARGQHVDARSDVWAFGVVLWELLTGRRLFRGQSTPDTLAAVLREPVDFKHLPLSTPREVQVLLAQCLERDPDKRLAEIGEARRTLERAAAGGGARGRIPGLTFAAAAVALILLTAGGVFVVRRWRAASVAPAVVAPSIAVLPFMNLGADKDQEYFSDGLSEELMGLLAKVKELHVAGRTSSFAFKGKTEELASIGQKLHVGTVLEGSVRRSGEQLRVSAQLVNVADGYQIWAETYNRKMIDVFAVQDEIAGAVVSALKVKLLSQGRPAASQHRTSNMEAYDQYLLGRQFWYRQSTDGYRRAVEAYEKAIALDPSYAAAYAGLATVGAVAAEFVAATPGEKVEGKQRAVAAADRAISLDPALAEGYSARGSLRVENWDWAGAQVDLERALSLDDSGSEAHLVYSTLLVSLGRLSEAIAEARKAIALDPLHSQAWFRLGMYLNAAGQLPEARKAEQRALEINPEHLFAPFHLGVTSLLEKNPGASLVEFQRCDQLDWRLSGVAIAEHDLGHAVESQQALDELTAKYGQRWAYRVALVYAWRGEKDRAFEWLGHAYAQRARALRFLKADPLFAKLRDDPRYMAMLKKMDLPVSD
jgi:TolB-like protein